jgi:hypothetical protein
LLIQQANPESLYNRILDAAMSLRSSDLVSMELFYPKRSRLPVTCMNGFHPQSAMFWEWVDLDSAGTCGLALSTGYRVAVADIETFESMAQLWCRYLVRKDSGASNLGRANFGGEGGVMNFWASAKTFQAAGPAVDRI